MVGRKIILINDEFQMLSSLFFLNGEGGWPSRTRLPVAHPTQTFGRSARTGF
jgi:hypothetical protein